MKNKLFILLAVFLIIILFINLISKDKNSEQINSSIIKQQNISTKPQNIDTNKLNFKVIESITGYKILVPNSMLILGKETQTIGRDGKIINKELRLKDTLSGTILIVKKIYPPYGNKIFDNKALTTKPIKHKNYWIITDTLTLEINGRGEKLENPQKILDIILKSNKKTIYQLQLKSTKNNFDKDLKWFNKSLNKFLNYSL